MEFVKTIEKDKYYWTWRDLPFLPYAWLDKKDLKNLPKPFFLTDIHPDCPIGFKTKEKDKYTNIIELPDSFEKIKKQFTKDAYQTGWRESKSEYYGHIGIHCPVCHKNRNNAKHFE